jgi:CubicO group peptidase (beta-lactamase class C family)
MTSGLKWKEIGSYGSFFNSETQMDISFNPVRYILNRAIVAIPGTEWNYSAGNTQLLAEIIFRKSGMTIDKYADKYIFQPLGIHQCEWVNLTFRHIPAAASGLRLTSRDLMKFGLLYLHNGNWNGSQLLDSAWVKESFNSFVKRPDLSRYGIPAGGYGFQFWTSAYTVNGRMIEIAEAKGNGGQSIFFCKSLNLLLITTGGNYNKADSNPYLILTRYILPAVKN